MHTLHPFVSVEIRSIEPLGAARAYSEIEEMETRENELNFRVWDRALAWSSDLILLPTRRDFPGEHRFESKFPFSCNRRLLTAYRRSPHSSLSRTLRPPQNWSSSRYPLTPRRPFGTRVTREERQRELTRRALYPPATERAAPTAHLGPLARSSSPDHWAQYKGCRASRKPSFHPGRRAENTV